jgi:hypothetical protein
MGFNSGFKGSKRSLTKWRNTPDSLESKEIKREKVIPTNSVIMTSVNNTGKAIIPTNTHRSSTK